MARCANSNINISELINIYFVSFSVIKEFLPFLVYYLPIFILFSKAFDAE